MNRSRRSTMSLTSVRHNEWDVKAEHPLRSDPLLRRLVRGSRLRDSSTRKAVFVKRRS